MRTEAEMKCDVCGCVTGHLTIAKPPKRPKDECQKCYWTREMNIDETERDAAIAERDAAIARAIAAEQMVAELRAVLAKRHHHDVAGG